MAYVDDGVIERLENLFKWTRIRKEYIEGSQEYADLLSDVLNVTDKDFNDIYLQHAKYVENLQRDFDEAMCIVDYKFKDPDRILKIHEELAQYMGKSPFEIWYSIYMARYKQGLIQRK